MAINTQLKLSSLMERNEKSVFETLLHIRRVDEDQRNMADMKFARNHMPKGLDDFYVNTGKGRNAYVFELTYDDDKVYFAGLFKVEEADIRQLGKHYIEFCTDVTDAFFFPWGRGQAILLKDLQNLKLYDRVEEARARKGKKPSVYLRGMTF